MPSWPFCSIEAGAPTAEATPYYLKEVWRWIRGTEFNHHSPEEWDDMAFESGKPRLVSARHLEQNGRHADSKL